ncbi:DUF4232 domain-containing protein [Streptomyces sp. GESEQ-35]|uniref:DUF4232 domain-containing protein n=1 Tax=Streptomyces sp. GESEQ-35 TaxID=2812657 RepID=UPI001B32B687|nr:DUF4232 domain-containing protein [Streptomyces sp. GESEQ-35]
MRPLLLTSSAALLLLLTACGTQNAGSSGGGSASACPTVVPGDPSGLERDGVRITGLTGAGCDEVEYEVTNRQREPFTFTITFDYRSGTGAVMANGRETVASVPAGRTVRRTLSRGDSGAGHVEISKVRSVPADEAPSEGGACPASGVRVYADEGDAAMGLRVVGLHLENCGTEAAYRLSGYPQLQLLDEDHEPVDSVRILRGGSAIASGTGQDDPPRALVLRPGERARTGLVWRNTTGAGDPVHAPYVRIRAKSGASPVTVIPELDLGTTGKLSVGAWQLDDAASGPAPGSDRPVSPPSQLSVRP